VRRLVLIPLVMIFTLFFPGVAFAGSPHFVDDTVGAFAQQTVRKGES